MKRRGQIFLALVLLLVVARVAWAATVASTTLHMQRGPVVVTCQGGSGSTVTIAGTDGLGRPTKAAAVIADVVSGQTVKILARVQYSNGTYWIDLVTDDSVVNLTTTVNALDLSTAAPGHPSPTKDAIDAAAMVSAGGS